jgi:hypothetical protein
MLTAVEKRGISLHVRDTSRQKFAKVEAPFDSTIGELVQGLVNSRMRLPGLDAEGRPLNYHARLEREGRHLHATETVGDALQEDDEIVLQPHITAGGLDNVSRKT